MDFRTILRVLEDSRTRGRAHFDSGYLATKVGFPKREASKYLSRLHQMGFLKRTRLKRDCISKRGRLCCKGYCYEYSFSKQGEKYIQWMAQHKPSEEIVYSISYFDTAPYIPQDVKQTILFNIATREGMRYKGSNQRLQNLGALYPALPALTKKLSETVAEREELKRKSAHLREELNQQISDLEKRNSKINELERRNLFLQDELTKKQQAEDSLGHKLTQSLMKEREFETEHRSAWRLLEQYYEGLIKDLGQLLMVMKPEEAPKVIEIIERRHSDARNMAVEHFRKAKVLGEELEEIWHNGPTQ